MARERAGTPPEDADGGDQIDRRKSRKRRKGDSSEDESSDSDRAGDHRSRRRMSREKRRSARRRSRSESGDEDSLTSSSDSETEESEESEEEARRRRRRKERRREREEEEERRRRKERKRKKEEKRRNEEEKRRRKMKKEKELGKTGAVTNSWGKYGVIREIDMWNKRPEFTAWLAEVKQVNLESLSNWEEKQMFKEFMEDHNTATFPSKKYYNLDAYHRRQLEKEIKKGGKKTREAERTVFNDEEQRRQELLIVRERLKEEQVEALKHTMQSGMAQAMKEQAQLREEMAYQYKVGNFEAAAAIQRRLDPDATI